MSLKTININGTSYEIGVSLAKIAEALELTEERFVELLSRDLYCPTLTSAPTSSTRTYTDTDASTNTFQIGQTCRWLDGSIYKMAILTDITSSAATWYILPMNLATVATSGSYNDLLNKPTIPSAVTESTVSGWGFTKNTGTYSKPGAGIPKSDLASDVQASLGKADTALQSYTEKYTGTITGITMNGASKGSSGVVDLGTVITDVSGKQDKNLYFTNQSASSWESDSTYSDFPYRCDIACTGVTADMYAEVIFDVTEAQSGNYAPICETKSGAVAIWSKENTAIQIPTITITK